MGASRSIIAMLLLGAGSAAAATTFQEVVVSGESSEENVLFAADSILRPDESSPVVAEGNVRAFYNDQSLLADKVVYDPKTDIVTAEGNVVIYDAEGQIYFADAVELTGDLKDGVASNFGALLQNENRLVGSTLVRRSSGVNSIENGAYTPCEICREDGSKKNPTWQVRAVRVTQDTNENVIRFRHATIEAYGVPVLYTPYFQFPDPSVKRKSGFLAPSLGNSSRAGFDAEIPYYWAISDYQDATLSPRYTSKLGTIWKGEYRVNTHDGGAIVQAGFIEPKGVFKNPNTGLFLIEDDFDQTRLEAFRQQGDIDVGTRWHLFAAAQKSLPDNWVASVDIDYVSDKTYLRTYDIAPEDELRESIDIVQPTRLENELRFTQRTDNSYTNISTVLFQSLRGGDDNDFMGDALPRIRHERYYTVPKIGGDLTLEGTFLVLNRAEGLDSMRTIGAATYDKVYTSRTGHRLRAFAELRADAYRYTDANLGVQSCRNDQPEGTPDVVFTGQYEACRDLLPRDGLEEEYSTSRFLPTAGVEWSYPLAKFTSSASYIIEPRVQLVVSPEEDYTDDVFNEDSAFFEFDTTTLFDWTKSTGYDLWEDGQRLNVGLRASANYDSGLNLSGAIGQQYRASESAAFDEETGLGQTTSDIVGEIMAGWKKNLVTEHRFRISDEDGTIRRLESSLRGKAGPLSGGIKYVRTETQDLSQLGQRDEYATASAYYRFTDRIMAGGAWKEDLDAGETTTQQLLVQYSDDCIIYSLAWRYDRRGSSGLEDNRSLTLNIDLIGF